MSKCVKKTGKIISSRFWITTRLVQPPKNMGKTKRETSVEKYPATCNEEAISFHLGGSCIHRKALEWKLQQCLAKGFSMKCTTQKVPRRKMSFKRRGKAQGDDQTRVMLSKDREANSPAGRGGEISSRTRRPPTHTVIVSHAGLNTRQTHHGTVS